jgi:hypothetical protein
MFASAIVAVVIQDGAVAGKAGPVSIAVSELRPNGSVIPDMTLAANMVSNAAAAAATAGYLTLIPSGDPPIYRYPTLHGGAYNYWFSSYGWVGHQGKLAWGVVSLVFGLSWFAAAIYMVKGGTAYDPTDWLQTMNTGAGSRLVQVPGTSTGSGLEGKHNDDRLLWYGEIGPQLVGFSSSPTVSVDPAKLYS